MAQVAYYWALLRCNVCAVNWQILATTLSYNDIAEYSVPRVANYLETFIRVLKANGANVSTMSMAGHSLGAHVAGQTGYKLQATGDVLDTIFGN